MGFLRSKWFECEFFFFTIGSWNDANCGRASAGYVCKKYPGNDHTPPPPTASWEGNCPEGTSDIQHHARIEDRLIC